MALGEAGIAPKRSDQGVFALKSRPRAPASDFSERKNPRKRRGAIFRSQKMLAGLEEGFFGEKNRSPARGSALGGATRRSQSAHEGV